MNLNELTLENVAEIKLEDLQKPGAPEAVKRLVDEVFDERVIGEAREVLRALEPLVLGLPAESQRQGYQKTLLPLKLLALPHLSPKEIESLLKQHTLTAMRLNINMNDQLGLTFIITIDDFTGGALRQIMIRALQQNGETLGHRPLTISGEEKKPPPEVRYWLKDYESRVGGQEVRTEYEISRYLSESPNVSQLNEDERAMLTQLLEIYDFLRFYMIRTSRVIEAEGILREAAKTGVFVPTSRVEEAGLTQSAVPKLVGAEVVQAYRGNPQEEEEIKTVAQALAAELGEDAGRYREQLWQETQSSRPDNQTRVIAILRWLAKSGALSNLLVQDRRYVEITDKYLITTGRTAAREYLKLSPRSPQSLISLLRVILEQQVGLSAPDSARQGAKIANILKQRGETAYQGLAFFDVKQKQFGWGAS